MTEASPGRRERWTRPQLAILVAQAVFSAVFIARTRFDAMGRVRFTLFDDAMISMRYAENLSRGQGLAWNAHGPHVEGYSDFLWTMYMALVHVFTGRTYAPLVVEVTGLVLLVVELVLVRRLALELRPGRPRLATLAMLFVASCYSLDYWTLRGSEVGLITVEVTAAAWLAFRVRASGSVRCAVALGLVLGLAALTRDDALVAVVVVVAWVAWTTPSDRRVRTLAAVTLPVVVMVVGHEVFRRIYYGAWLPNTYYLKATGIALSTRMHRGVDGLVMLGTIEVWCPVALVVAFLVSRRARVGRRSALLLALVGAQVAYDVFVGGDAFESGELLNRFLCPVLPALMVLTAQALDTLVGEVSDRRSAAVAFAVAAAPAVVLRCLDVRPGRDLQLGSLPAQWWPVRSGVALVVLGCLLAVVATPRWTRSALPVGVVAVVAALTVKDLTWWTRHNAFLDDQIHGTVLGLGLAATTPPGTVIAFSAAGSPAYFSDRPALDLAGKSDAVIARERPRSPVFIPGHDKYDYAYSVGVLRPDVVICPVTTTAENRALIASFGYFPVGLHFYVRSGARGIDLAGLRDLNA